MAMLTPIKSFVDGFVSTHRLPSDVEFILQLVLEELFTNMVRHNPEGSSEIGIVLQLSDGHVIVELSEDTEQPFDPASHPEVDVRASLEQRKPGGLGIHLVKKFMDDMSYHYENHRGTLTLKRRVEVPNA
jgi:serine/threonine-protein kinase RsbW